MLVRDDAGVIVVVQQRRIHVVNAQLDRGDGGVLHVRGHHDVVGREADLTRVHHLAHGDAFARLLEIGRLAENHR